MANDTGTTGTVDNVDTTEIVPVLSNAELTTAVWWNLGSPCGTVKGWVEHMQNNNVW